MSIRHLPAAPEAGPRAGLRWDISPRALQRWDSGVRAATTDDDRTIGIYDVIGADYWTGEGVTAKRVAAALRNMGKGPVAVNVNSPGGDMFEGLAIYNLLREHEGEVTVKVLGLAASAASVITMAADTIQIGRASFEMIHNCWCLAIGNRHEMREMADLIEPFDAAMADVYAARSGQSTEAVMQMMDAETWLGGSDAIDKGFADELLPSDQVREEEASARAAGVRRMEMALRASGMSRKEAQKLIHEVKSSLRDAAGTGGDDPAGSGASDSLQLSTTAALAASMTNILRR